MAPTADLLGYPAQCIVAQVADGVLRVTVRTGWRFTFPAQNCLSMDAFGHLPGDIFVASAAGEGELGIMDRRGGIEDRGHLVSTTMAVGAGGGGFNTAFPDAVMQGVAL